MSRSQQGSLFTADELPENPLPWELAAERDRLFAEVVFDLPLPTTFHYLVPEELRELIRPGQRVQVPFGAGNRAQVGFCVGLTAQLEVRRRMKSLLAVLDREPLLSADLLDLSRWIAEHYLCGWGQVIQSMIPAGVKAQAGTREILFFELGADYRDRLKKVRLTPKQQAVVQALEQAGRPLKVDELSAAAECGVGPINKLRDHQILQPLRERTLTAAVSDVPFEQASPIRLNPDQQRVIGRVLDCLRAQQHRTFLLHGVTGSGKTEVYIRAIEEIVSYGRQAIVLVPEISLTPQTIRRFRARFPDVAVLHSHLTASERHAWWQQIARGDVQVVVGARSAVFAPTPHLGLIVIDEEHESSFKQETTPRYHAREVARRRAEAAKIPLLLGSATPTLESWQRARDGRDELLSMPRRVASRPLPPVVIVDTRDDPYVSQGRALGRALVNSMQQTLASQGQIILFLNVRGYAPILWCRQCGAGIKCPDCDVTLNWHKELAVAICHSCNHQEPVPTHCPKCHQGNLRHLGIGTERLEAEVRSRFPEAKVLRMDSDSMRARGSHDAAFEAVRDGHCQILLGTQMIAKGLDFPNVTLVGVIDADTALHQPDLRASERTFQLLSQVAGRTGRGPKGGRVLVQTACPQQPAIVHASRHDYLQFAVEELEVRRALHLPPWTHLLRVLVRGDSEPQVAEGIEQIAGRCRSWVVAEGQADQIRFQGPAPCPLTRLQNKYRYHLQITAADLGKLHTLWRAVQAELRFPDEVEYTVDVDPMQLK